MNGTRILVVGGLGFIGVNLVAKLNEAGAQTTIVARDRAKHAEQASTFERATPSFVVIWRVMASATSRCSVNRSGASLSYCSAQS